MRIVFDELAKMEYDDTIEYYEFQLRGLGYKFKDEIKRALKNIQKFPEIGMIEEAPVRRYVLHQFPFKILYSIEKKYIYVIAIAHLHREPTYWHKRLR